MTKIDIEGCCGAWGVTHSSLSPSGGNGLCCACVHAKLLHLYLTLCDVMDRIPLDSSVHGILQAGILEWVAISSSRGSSQPRDQT